MQPRCNIPSTPSMTRVRPSRTASRRSATSLAAFRVSRMTQNKPSTILAPSTSPWTLRTFFNEFRFAHLLRSPDGLVAPLSYFNLSRSTCTPPPLACLNTNLRSSCASYSRCASRTSRQMSFLPRESCGCSHPSMHARLATSESHSASLTATRDTLSRTITHYCSTTSSRLTALHDDLDHIEFAIKTSLGQPAYSPPAPRPSSPVPTPQAIAAHIAGTDLRQIRRESILERWNDIDISDVQEELELDDSTFGCFLTPETLDRIDQRLATLEKMVSDAVVNAHRQESSVRIRRPRCSSLPCSLQKSFIPLRGLYH